VSKNLSTRLVGTTVLFIAAVIIIPWLLNGNQHYVYQSTPLALPVLLPELEEKTTKIEITTPEAQLSSTATEQEKRTQLVTNPIVDDSLASDDPSAAYSITHPLWTIRVATFVNIEAVMKLRDQLRMANYRCYVRKVHSKNSKIVAYKVYVGPSLYPKHLEQQLAALRQWQLQPEIINFIDDIEQDL
jgi:cell division septation protein DedD